MPPLRERGSDLFLLSGYFIEKCRTQLGLQNLSLSSECHDGMLNYGWPGNVRELEHCIHRAAVLAKAEALDEFVLIQPRHFGALFQGSNEALSEAIAHTDPVVAETKKMSLKEATAIFQRQLITQTLKTNNNSWAETARQLSLDTGNLHRLAKRLGLK